jgi:hypothetical protein
MDEIARNDSLPDAVSMGRAFVAVNHEQFRTLALEIAAIVEILHAHSFRSTVFAAQQEVFQHDPSLMMRVMQMELNHASLLVAETTHIASEISFAVGYMAARVRPIIVLQRATRPDTPVIAGVAAQHIAYDDLEGLRDGLADALAALYR